MEALAFLVLILIVVAGIVLWKCLQALVRLDRGVTKFGETESTLTYIRTMVDETRQLGVSTHALVNSNMGAQLLLTSSALHRVAALTNDPEDITAAEKASALYQDHVNRQTAADREEVQQVRAPRTST